jgi:outer membrane protein assembly factor BamB
MPAVAVRAIDQAQGLLGARGAVAAGLLGLWLAWTPAALGQGTKLWEFATGGVVNSSAAIGPDGAVYFGSADGKVYALNSNGTLRWALRTGGAVWSSPAVGGDGTVYVGSLDGKLYALGGMGAVRWAFPTKDVIYSSPAIGVDGTVYVSSMDGKLYAVAPNGVQRWEFATDAGIYSSPIIGANGAIYVGSRDGGFYAISPDGARKWRWATGNWVEAAAAIGPGGTIYVGSLDGKVYALNPDGAKLWEYAAGAAVYASPAVGLDGMVYVASNDGHLHALTPQGTNKWEAVLDNRVGYSSVAIAADGTLYVAATDGKLYGIGPDGQRRWAFQTTNSIIYSSPNIAADGTVYIGSSDGRLSAVKGSSGPAGGVWPMFRRDAGHTASGFVERVLPAAYSPGAEMTVTLVATPPPGVDSYAVEDTPPANWQVGEISDNGYFDSESRRVRFGPFLDGLSRRLSYKTTPPLGESGRKVFLGTSAARSAERLIGGNHVLDLIPLHPADNQPVDNWLTIGELTAYGAAWKRGSAWQVGPNPIPSSYLTWAIVLWQGGEFYRYDTNAASAPQWWSNPPGGLTTNPPPASLPAGTLATNGTAVATMPLTYTPGSDFLVQIAVTPLTNVVVYAVEDCPPTNWTVAQISAEGLFDAARAKVKWGPFFDHLPRTLTYRVTPSTNSGKFYGVASFDGSTGEITGQREAMATGPSATGSWVERELPPGYAGGVKLVVTLRVWPSTNVTFYAVEDTPPANWQVGQISDNGCFDDAHGRVRYGPFDDHRPRTLTYEVTPPADESGLKQFAGSLWVDGVEQMIGGDFSLSFIPLHPADIQPIDSWLTIGELTAYAAAWKHGAAWPNPPTPIPLSYVTQALDLWLGGELYRCNTNVTNAPLWWTNLTSQALTNGTPPALPPGNLATNGQATATMPLTITPGQAFAVSITVTPATNVAVYAVEDQPPAGWQVSQVTTEGALDPFLGKVKWGPFFDAAPRTLTYQITAPTNAAATGEFSGVAAFDGVEGEIGGQRQIRVSSVSVPANFVTRKLPSGYSPGAELVVSLQVMGLTNGSFYVVEDSPPANWLVGLVSDNGVYDGSSGTVRFGPFFDGQPRTLSYELTPPASETGPKQFSGLFSVDGVQGQVIGDALLDLIPLHPADAQPADSWLTIGELTAYAAAWKHGAAWPNPPTPIPLAYLTQAIQLWQSGEFYRYDTNLGPAPFWWAAAQPTDAPGSQPPPPLPPATTATNGLATAALPATLQPGGRLTVTITVVPATNVTVYAVEDQPPAGWQPVELTGEGWFDAALGKVKWGPFFDSAPRTFSYQVTAPADAAGLVQFNGAAAFDGAVGSIGGERATVVFGGEMPGGFVQRRLPAAYSAGAKLVVSLQTAAVANLDYYVVEDAPPANWQVGQISDGGWFDPVNGWVKFGPFFDGAARLLSYEVTPPLGESGARQFSGTWVMNDLEGPTGGDDTINSVPLHPADAQPIDSWLTIGEITAYAAAWKRGDTWMLPPNPIPAIYLARAINLWLGGELYGYDATVTNAPAWWVNLTNQVPPAEAPPPCVPGSTATNGSAIVEQPRYFDPATPFTIAITVAPATNVLVYAVEDQPPEGWGVLQITDNGSYDQRRNKVKWGPFYDAAGRRLTYRVLPPAQPLALAKFSGAAAFDGAAADFSGRRQSYLRGLPVAPSLESLRFDPTSGLELSLKGFAGEVYEVQVSTNLIHWQLLASVTNTAATVQYLDAEATNHPLRFYRAVWP